MTLIDKIMYLPVFIQSVEMKGLDSSVVCEQMKKCQQNEKSPSEIGIASKPRQDCQIDEKGCQIYLKVKDFHFFLAAPQKPSDRMASKVPSPPVFILQFFAFCFFATYFCCSMLSRTFYAAEILGR